MKKILICFTILIFQFSFLKITSAELIHFDTTDTSYKTYFDSESLQGYEDGDLTILLARIVGYTPKNEKILDIVEKFTVIDKELYYSVFERDWEKGGDMELKTFLAIIDYLDKKSDSANSNSSVKNPLGDVWIQSDARGDWYVQTHRISEDFDSKEFTVPLKLVVEGRVGNNRPQLFKYSGGIWYAKYRDSSMDFELVKNVQFVQEEII